MSGALDRAWADPGHSALSRTCVPGESWRATAAFQGSDSQELGCDIQLLRLLQSHLAILRSNSILTAVLVVSSVSIFEGFSGTKELETFQFSWQVPSFWQCSPSSALLPVFCPLTAPVLFMENSRILHGPLISWASWFKSWFCRQALCSRLSQQLFSTHPINCAR